MLETENTSALTLTQLLAGAVLQRQKQGKIKWMNGSTELFGLYVREINTGSGGDGCHGLTGCGSLSTSTVSFAALSKQ